MSLAENSNKVFFFLGLESMIHSNMQSIKLLSAISYKM